MITIKVNVARVFVDKSGKFGNPVGIVIDENQKLAAKERQKIATKLNFSETVFIESLDKTPAVSIFNPLHKVKFAGHAVLGTIYFINHLVRKNIDSVKCSKQIVKVKYTEKVTYLTAPLPIMPHWNFEELSSLNEVENMSKETALNKEHTVVWAWINQDKGFVRARTFAPDWGIPEDQANGSGSMLLASNLSKDLEIVHGIGSHIFAKPVNSKSAEVGGLVALDKSITLRLTS